MDKQKICRCLNEEYIGNITDTSSTTCNINVKQGIENISPGCILYLDTRRDVCSDSATLAIVTRISCCERPFSEYYEGERSDTTYLSTILDAVLIGSVSTEEPYIFSRHAIAPNISVRSFRMKDEDFKQIFSSTGMNRLDIGVFSDFNCDASVDGNKLLQRHLAILGSTGSGKSWAVSKLLEKLKNLKSTNVIIMDIHGEYNQSSFDKISISGFGEDNSLILPYWLLNSTELVNMFIDRSEYTAQNQVSVFLKTVLAEKIRYANAYGHTELINSLTVNSPVQFDINRVIDELESLDTEMECGSRGGQRQGKFYGYFTRVISRMKNRIADKRYSFLFRECDLSLLDIVNKLLSTEISSIKAIDFSDVPVEILPTVVGIVARIIYQTQLWTSPRNRHPILIVADECHVYIPRDNNQTTSNSSKIFERIAKEGRKLGIAAAIISQRPSEVSETILSQISNMIVLKTTNQRDKGIISSLLPDNFSGLIDTLSSLDVGECIVVGDAVELPLRILLSKPDDPPSSQTIDFYSDWSSKPPMTRSQYEESISNMQQQRRE